MSAFCSSPGSRLRHHLQPRPFHIKSRMRLIGSLAISPESNVSEQEKRKKGHGGRTCSEDSSSFPQFQHTLVHNAVLCDAGDSAGDSDRPDLSPVHPSVPARPFFVWLQPCTTILSISSLFYAPPKAGAVATTPRLLTIPLFLVIFRGKKSRRYTVVSMWSYIGKYNYRILWWRYNMQIGVWNWPLWIVKKDSTG